MNLISVSGNASFDVFGDHSWPFGNCVFVCDSELFSLRVSKQLQYDMNMKLASHDPGIYLHYLSVKFHLLSFFSPDVKLLFLTPEKLAKTLLPDKSSSKLKRLLLALHMRKKLARFVFDEAHCTVLWGTEFRYVFSLILQLPYFFARLFSLFSLLVVLSLFPVCAISFE